MGKLLALWLSFYCASALAADALKPEVAGVSAASSPITAAAPGSILSIYGTNLAAFTSNVAGAFALTGLPSSFNGVSVSIAGRRAPLFYISPSQINVQMPFETPPGAQTLIVATPAGASAAIAVETRIQAPSIFLVDRAGAGALLKNSDFSLLTPSNPAAAGEIVLVYSTGLGQTSPALQSGSLKLPAAGSFNNTAGVTASLGGKPATVVYSIASPGFAGLYQTAVAVPAGLTGTVPLVLTAGLANSNAVDVTVR